jgi:Raf kinase inhibitor-like YbhB/YbcL family protein
MGIGKLEVKLEFSEFPRKYTCDGEDVSPKIEISGIGDAKSIAIVVDDPDAPIGTFTHWLIWNIEPVEVIPENIPKKGEITDPLVAVQGRNDFGNVGYNGPCPPPGKPHRYFFKVYALDTKLDILPGSGKSEVERAIEGHVLQYGETVATYGR